MRTLAIFTVAILFVTAGAALAVSAGKVIEFNNSPMGVVKFDGTLHKEKGNVCKDCHIEGMFPKMKQGTVKITMEQIYAGKLCGVCHNGKRAFGTQGNCQRCHLPPKK